MRRSRLAGLLTAGLAAGLMTGCEPAAPPAWHASIFELDADGIDSAAQTPTFSPDGSRVVFRTWRALLPEDTNRWEDLYARDLRTGETQLVTVNLTGTSSSDPSYPELAVFSADGSKVAFESYATDLVAPSTDGNDNVFVRDLVAGTTTLVSVDETGTGGGNGSSRGPSFSPDGTRIAFSSTATNLGPTTHGIYPDIFLRDLVAGTTSLVSIRNDGQPGSGISDGPVSFTPDGGKVVFTSSADLTGVYPPQYAQLYVRDLAAGNTTLLSVNAAGQAAEYGVDAGVVLSPDGAKVAFTSFSSNLVPTDTNGQVDVFLHDLPTGTTALVSSNDTGIDSGNARSFGPVFSPDGATVAFATFATDLGPVDTNNETDVYLRDILGGTSSLVTATASGTDGAGGSDPAFDATGTKVAFVSGAGSLGPVDSNGLDDVYVRDLVSQTTSLVSANATGTDSGRGWSTGPVFKVDGALVFESTATDLDPRQTPDSRDLFVARPPAVADLTVDLAVEPPPATGQEVVVVATGANGSLDDAAGTTLAVLLPEGTTFVDATSGAGTCGAHAPEQPRLVVCEVGTLPAGATPEVRVTAAVVGAEGTPLTFVTAIASSAYDPDLANNIAAVDTQVGAAGPS